MEILPKGRIDEEERVSERERRCRKMDFVSRTACTRDHEINIIKRDTDEAHHADQ